MGEDSEAVCPKCMAPARKMISGTIFVGSSFYRDIEGEKRKSFKNNTCMCPECNKEGYR